MSGGSGPPSCFAPRIALSRKRRPDQLEMVSRLCFHRKGALRNGSGWVPLGFSRLQDPAAAGPMSGF